MARCARCAARPRREDRCGPRARPAVETSAAAELLGGHIPGARSLPVEELLDPTGRLLPEPELRAVCDRLGIDPDDHVVSYCGVADRSALVWFVLHELLGWPAVACYYGAWSEYGSLTDVPVERGP